MGISQNDTTQLLKKYDHLKKLLQVNTDSCYQPIKKAIHQCEEMGFYKGSTQYYLLLSNYYMFKGQPDSVLSFLPNMEKAASLYGDTSHYISVLLKAALIFSDRGDFRPAVSKALQAQRYAEKFSNLSVRAKIFHDLGYIYSNKELHPSALNYFKQGLYLAEKARDTFSIANLCARIGGTLNESFLPDSALPYNLRSLKLFQQIKLKRGIGVALNNVAGTYDLLKNFKKAVEYYSQALQLRMELGDEYALTILYYNLGVSHSYLKDFKRARVHLLSSLSLSRKQNNVQMVVQNLKQLATICSATNDLNSYHIYAKEYIALKDSITKSENIKAISDLQHQYEAEKREQSIANLKNEVLEKEEKHQLEKKNKILLLSAAGGIILILLFSGVTIYRRYKVTQKQNSIIEEQRRLSEQQRMLIEEKQKEILDSIHYAKRIQNALMTNETYFQKFFNKLKK
jgi:tetratricopeptide (TPR) repeat protein